MNSLQLSPPAELLESLQAPNGPSWATLWPVLQSLDDGGCAMVEPLCARFSDEDREVPLAARKALLDGADPPPALLLCRSLDWTNFPNERTRCDEDIFELFPRIIALAGFHGLTHLLIADEAKYLTTSTLDGFSTLKHLAIRTREAYTSAIRDDHCSAIGNSKTLRTLESLTIEHCDITGKGLACILRSPHIGPLSSLELCVPARMPFLTELSRATTILKGLSRLGLAADHLSGSGARRLADVRDSLTGLRVLRIVAGESGGFDWERPFNRYDGSKNVHQLAKALATLLPALEGLERLEIVHGLGSRPVVTTKDGLITLQKPKDILEKALPSSMR